MARVLRKNRPLSSMPRITSSSCSGLASRLSAFGIVARKPDASSGVTIMKMISSTSMMSIIGTTFGSDLTAVVPALLPADMPTAGHRLLGLEFLGEDRAPELAPHALDHVIDQLLGRIGHLDREVLDLGGEVVVRPHRRDGDEQAEGRRNEGLGDTGRDAR